MMYSDNGSWHLKRKVKRLYIAWSVMANNVLSLFRQKTTIRAISSLFGVNPVSVFASRDTTRIGCYFNTII